jgi:hypothetical protein
MKNIRTEQEKKAFETAMKISSVYQGFVLKYGTTLLRDAAFFALIK